MKITYEKPTASGIIAAAVLSVLYSVLLGTVALLVLTILTNK